MSIIGRNIRAVRKSLDMTQEDLAKKAGYKTSTMIVAIENGSSEPSYEKVKDIANALGVNIYQIRGSKRERDAPNGKVFYSVADITALDMFSPLIASMDEEEVVKLLDYGLLILKAKGDKPKWKLPKYKEKD